jgi:hypothetical protein
MVQKRLIIIALLFVGISMLNIGGGLWLYHKLANPVTIPEGDPVVVMEITHIMRGTQSHLAIYINGNIVYFEEDNTRIATFRNPPMRIWKVGVIPEEDLNILLELLKNGGLVDLSSYYQFSGQTATNGGYIRGDMIFTIITDYGDLRKTVTADGYLDYMTPVPGITYEHMPYPLDEIYQRFINIVLNTKEVARQRIP